jgi:Anthrone oxygenase
MLELAQLVAVMASTLFGGAALYVSLVEHPARLSCGTELAATEFGPSYKRATVMQVSLAVIAAVAGGIGGLTGGGAIWFVGAAGIFAVIPFTLLFMLPVNNKILDPARDKASRKPVRFSSAGAGCTRCARFVSLAAALPFHVAWAAR